jgi:hypothetical protein
MYILGICSVLECLPSMLEALGSIASTRRQTKEYLIETLQINSETLFHF